MGAIFLRRRFPGLVEVINESHDIPAEYHYIVTLDDVTGDLMVCTCPYHVHRHAHCTHMVAVEDATADGSLDAVPADDDTESADDDDAATRVTGPHVGHDKHGHFDHRFWRCECCGTETTDKCALDNCC